MRIISARNDTLRALRQDTCSVFVIPSGTTTRRLGAAVICVLLGGSFCAPGPAAGTERSPARRPIIVAGSEQTDKGLALSSSETLSPAAESSERRRQLRLLELRTLQMRNDTHHDPQALSDKIGWLEADVAELKRIAEHLQDEAAALTPVAAKITLPVAAVTGSTAVPGAPDRATPVDAALPGASQTKSGGWPSVQQASALDPGEWAAYVGLAAAALLLSVLLFRHRAPRRERFPPSLAELPSTPGNPALLWRDKAQESGREPPAPLSAAPFATASAPADAGRSAATPAEPQTPALLATGTAESELTAAGTTLDLAEIMLTFGRVGGAAKTLHEYVSANPKEALRPWIRLLQIYQDHGMREEFEAMAVKLNRNFNVEIIRWPAEEAPDRMALLPMAPDPSRAATLEDLPHVRDRILSLWGGPDCLAYLEQLLRGNRDGQRNGFTMPVVEELLFLIELLAAREMVR